MPQVKCKHWEHSIWVVLEWGKTIYFCCKDTELNFSMLSTVMGQKGTFAPWENKGNIWKKVQAIYPGSGFWFIACALTGHTNSIMLCHNATLTHSLKRLRFLSFLSLPRKLQKIILCLGAYAKTKPLTPQKTQGKTDCALALNFPAIPLQGEAKLFIYCTVFQQISYEMGWM